MNVPMSLRRRPMTEPATALLLMSSDVADLLRLCARIGGDPLPRIHAVADGFLLQLAAPTTATLPRTIRLRAAVPNLLLPADADLVPALLDDEARGLVSQHGLAFLPGGKVLRFAFDQPVALAALVAAPPVRQSAWQALPTVAPLADRLHEIVLDLPQPPVDDILEPGAEDIATEEPRPSEGGMLDTLRGKAALNAGKGMMGLGKLLGLKALADMGARWVQNAIERAPRLSESILGRQEAALRELLRLFRNGKLDQALRRALPLGGAGGRGGVASASDRLPLHSLAYSLANLLGSAAGRASIWFGGYDVQVELAKEYRKAAEEAAQRGDYRRAAFIYGKLLQDYRSAANVLFQGGLYRDAAAIYLTQLDDRYWAARAYEAAGEIDTALQLYRQLGRHVEAGNLLRRIGEEEAALAEYRIAADRMTAAGDWLGAGDLLNQAGWPEAAQAYYEEGWAHRPDKNAVACALRLGNLYQAQAAGPRIVGLVREARAHFDPPGNYVGACQFYQAVTKLADAPNLTATRDDIRDDALLGVAVKLRQTAALESRPGDTVASYLGTSGVWAAPVVSDAHYAFRAAVKDSAKDLTLRATKGPRLGNGTVTAIASAPASGDLFVAFDSGDLVCFRPALNETRFVKAGWNPLEVVSLAVDPQGDFLLTLQVEDGAAQLSGYVRRPNGSFALQQHTSYTSPAAWLCPLLLRANGIVRVGVFGGGDLCILDWPSLATLGPLDTWGNEAGFGALLIPGFGIRADSIRVLHWYSGSASFYDLPNRQGQNVTIGWNLGKLRESPAQSIPLAWLQAGNTLELAGINDDGALHWSRLTQAADKLEETARCTATPDEGYRAAAIVRPGLVAGVTRTGVNWLRGGQRFLQVAQNPVETGSRVIAAFASLPTQELLLVCADGLIERLAVPNV